MTDELSVQQHAMNLERKMVNYDEALPRVHPRLREIAERERAIGTPCGFAWEDGVWYLLMAGQGPMIADEARGER